jgi:AcrR family transcriptional regulator
MKPKPRNPAPRRQPRQKRAQQTVEVVLDAVIAVLKRDGVSAVTTNRIAEVAGVSIGSVYQYFPDKRAIFMALHARHVDQIGSLVERTLVEHSRSSLPDLVRALVEAMIEAHTVDPELFELLHAEVPHRAHGARDFESRLRGVLRLALTARAKEIDSDRDVERVLFVLTHMVDSLSHAAAIQRPSRLSLSAARDEVVRAVLAYLKA